MRRNIYPIVTLLLSMVDVPEPRFCDNLKYPIPQSTHSGKQTTSSIVECKQDGNVNRSRNARLCEPVTTHRKYRPDIPGDSVARSRCDPDPLHPCYRGTGVFDLRKHYFHDRGINEERFQIIQRIAVRFSERGQFSFRLPFLRGCC